MDILVVDDEESIRGLVSRALSAAGHGVHVASSVNEAESVLNFLPSIDLVITDIRMPGRDGIELLHDVKRLKPGIEVIMMTAFAEVATLADAIDAHTFAYLRKPFCAEELTKVVEQADRHIKIGKVLKASELRYRTLVEGINAAVLSTDRNLIIKSASERCTSVIGRSAEQLIGQPLDALRPIDQQSSFHEKTVALLEHEHGTVHMNGHVVRADGAILDTLESATPFDKDNSGLPHGFFWIIEDVTEERQSKAAAELASDYLEAIRRSRSPGRIIVGESQLIKNVLHLIQSVASSAAPVLVCGESGTGKELVAESIHINSLRAAKPFVVINCATLQENLLESELFGHKKGSFTGAVQDKRGLVEIANGGTLFVDEIAEAAPSIQAKMLRVLEQGQFRRVGGVEDRTTDIRVIAATNRDLATEVKDGRFREDLLYRLDVIRITMPPLRDRKDDIPLIAEHLLRHSSVTQRQPKSLTSEAIEALMSYNWPGNIRELSNVIERAVILSGENSVIGAEYLSVSPAKPGSAVRHLEELEQIEMDKALAMTGGNKTRAAQMLGITRQTLISRLKRRTERTEHPVKAAKGKGNSENQQTLFPR